MKKKKPSHDNPIDFLKAKGNDPVSQCVAQWLNGKLHQPLLVNPLGTGMGKTYASILQSIIFSLEEQAKNRHPLIQFLVHQKTHCAECRADFEKLAKEVGKTTEHFSGHIVTGEIGNGQLSFLTLASRQDILLTIKKKLNNNPQTLNDWTEMLSAWKEKVSRAHAEIRRLNEQIKELNKERQKQKKGLSKNTEADYAKIQQACLEAEEELERRTAYWEGVLCLPDSLEWSAKADDSIVSSLKQLQACLKSLHPGSTDEEINTASICRNHLRDSFCREIDLDDRDSPWFELIDNILRKTALHKKTENGWDLVLLLAPELYLRHCDICITTVHKAMFPFTSKGTTADALLLSNVYRERKTTFIMDECNTGYQIQREIILNRCLDHPVNVSRQLNSLMACAFKLPTPGLNEQILNQTDPFTRKSLGEAVREPLQQWQEEYGVLPCSVVIKDPAHVTMLSKEPLCQVHTPFIGNRIYPLALFRCGSDRLKEILLIKENNKSRTYLQTLTLSKTQKIPDSCHQVLESRYLNQGRAVVRQVLKMYAETAFPVRFAAQIQGRYPDTEPLKIMDFLHLNKTSPSGYNINPMPSDLMFEKITMYLAKNPLWKDVREEMIKSCFEYDVIKDPQASTPEEGDKRYRNDPTLQDLYQQFESLILMRLEGKKHLSPNFSRSKFCLENTLRMPSKQFHKTGLASFPSPTAMSIIDRAVTISPEAILCELLDQGSRVMLLSATALLKHSKNFYFPQIKAELTDVMVPIENIKNFLAQAKQQREEKLDKDQHFDVAHTEDQGIELLKEMMAAKVISLTEEELSQQTAEPLVSLAAGYWHFLNGFDPHKNNYVCGAILFATRAPKTDSANEDCYRKDNINRIIEYLIKKAVREGILPETEAQLLYNSYSQNNNSYYIELNNKTGANYVPSENKDADDLQPLKQKINRANEDFQQGIRPFFITTYAACGVGYNILFSYPKTECSKIVQTINNLNRGQKAISPNLLILTLPTQYIPVKKQCDDQDRPKFELETLYQGLILANQGDIAHEQLFDFWKNPDSLRRNSLPSYGNWVMDTLLQAVGRSERSNYRLPHTYLFLGPTLCDKMHNYSRSSIMENLPGISAAGEVLCKDLLCSQYDLSQAQHSESESISKKLQNAEKAFQDVFTPHFQDPESKRNYQAFCEELLDAGPCLTPERWRALSPALQSVYIKMPPGIAPWQIVYTKGDIPREYAVIKQDSRTHRLHPYDQAGKSQYDPYELSGIRGCMDRFDRRQAKTAQIETFFKEAFAKSSLFKEALANRFGHNLPQTAYYVASPDACLKIKGMIHEQIAPLFLEACKEKFELNFTIVQPDPTDPDFELFDLYLADPQGKKYLAIDLKYFAYPPDEKQAEEIRQKYAKRLEGMPQVRGIILQILPYVIQDDQGSYGPLNHILQLSQNLRAVGPVCNRNWIYADKEIDLLKDALTPPK